MTQIYNAGIPVQAYSIQQKRTNSPQTPVNFKAGRDEFIRNVQNRQSDFTKIMEERQKEQNKAKRKQKWMSALQIGALVSTIALAGFFIWQGTRGNKKAMDDAANALTDVKIDWTKFDDKTKVASLDSETTADIVRNKFRSLIDLTNLSDAKKAWSGMKDRSRLYYMYGESGVGKTYAVQQLAQEMGAEYTCIKYGDLGSPYKDAGSMKILNLFRNIANTASENPGKKYVVCIDEIDSLLRTVGGHSSDEAAKARGSVLTGMDELVKKCKNVTLVATSNYHPDSKLIDKASMRRFNKGKIEVPLPNRTQAKALLKMYLGKVGAIDDKFYSSKEFSEFVDELVTGKYANGEIQNIAEGAADDFAAHISKVADGELSKHPFKLDFLRKARESLGQAAAISNETMRV